MIRRSRLALAPLAFAVALTSCASSGATSGASPSLSYGYLVPGEQVASALGVNATDTLPELAPTRILSSVMTNAIDQEVKRGNWNAKCTRRFGGPASYAVIFHRVCDSSAGPEADPQVIVGFNADGSKKANVRWTGANTVSKLVPARRF